MTILNADRFGLAQLHQLRGRVGRGPFPGYVGLFADPKSTAAQVRLSAILSTSDGFALAEMDLEQRGPGEFFGTRQHGVPHFRVAKLPADAGLLQLARQAALELLTQDPALIAPQHAPLRQQVLSRYGARLELGQIG
jgi:ATP-dependent DNA helicase RecG